jgi:16S rRNA (adenine1518-N6/adenine1519-N6)-dimethyltransferase
MPPPDRDQSRPPGRTTGRGPGGRGPLPPKKSLGQNFCRSERLIVEMVTALGISPADQVWEIGPGTGVLTEALVAAASRVTAFEADPRAERVLRERFGEAFGTRLVVVWGDVLTAPLTELSPGSSTGWKICGNLPYYCGTAIVKRCLALDPPPERLVFLLQAEVARKAAAGHGSKDYGFLSLEIQWFAVARTGVTFPPEAFYPPPKVDSSLLILTPLALPPAEVERRRQALQKASALFHQRRKMALSVLRRSFPHVTPTWEDRFAALGIAPTVRAEELSPACLLDLLEPRT